MLLRKGIMRLGYYSTLTILSIHIQLNSRRLAILIFNRRMSWIEFLYHKIRFQNGKHLPAIAGPFVIGLTDPQISTNKKINL